MAIHKIRPGDSGSFLNIEKVKTFELEEVGSLASERMAGGSLRTQTFYSFLKWTVELGPYSYNQYVLFRSSYIATSSNVWYEDEAGAQRKVRIGRDVKVKRIPVAWNSSGVTSYDYYIAFTMETVEPTSGY